MTETFAAGILFWIIVAAPSAFYIGIVCAYRIPLYRKLRTIEAVFTDTGAEDSPNDLYAKFHGRTAGAKEVKRDIDQRFQLFYRKANYFLPTTLNCLVGSAVMVLALSRMGFPHANMGLPVPIGNLIDAIVSPGAHDPITLGLLGALVWGFYDNTRRFHVTDLTPACLNYIWLRVLIVGVLTYVLSKSMTGNASLVVSFAVGVFPLEAVRNFLLGRAKKSLDLSLAGQPSAEPTLHHLQGASESVINRLAEEGIDCAQALAYVDPIVILFKTNLEWEVILDLIDQALLYIYAEKKIDVFRRNGIRSAIDLAWLGAEARRKKFAATSNEVLLLKELAKELEISEEAARNLAVSFDADPRVDLIWTLWLRHQRMKD